MSVRLTAASHVVHRHWLCGRCGNIVCPITTGPVHVCSKTWSSACRGCSTPQRMYVYASDVAVHDAKDAV
jgi:hypothetical protein